MALMVLCRQSPPALTAAAMSHAYPYVTGTMAGTALSSSSSNATNATRLVATSAGPSSTGTNTNANGLPTIYKFRSDLMTSQDATMNHQQYHQQQYRFKSAVIDQPHGDDGGHPPTAGGFDADFFKKIMNNNQKAYDNITRHAIDVVRGHVHDREAGNRLQILDLASGPGEPAASLANAFPEATIYATDINPAMVKAAQERGTVQRPRPGGRHGMSERL